MEQGTHTVRIESIRRLNNSLNGNGRFELVVSTPGWAETHILKTATDAGFTYSIGNPGFRVHDVIEITVNGRGTIAGMKNGTVTA